MIQCEFFATCNECGRAAFWSQDRKQVIREAKAAGWYVKAGQVFCPNHKPVVATIKLKTAVAGGTGN